MYIEQDSFPAIFVGKFNMSYINKAIKIHSSGHHIYSNVEIIIFKQETFMKMAYS